MFKVGQRVVANEDCPIGRFKKGDIKEILALQTCKCGRTVIDWGDNLPEGIYQTKCFCGKNHSGIGIWWSYAQSFSPIISDYQRITYSKVLEQVECCAN